MTVTYFNPFFKPFLIKYYQSKTYMGWNVVPVTIQNES